MFRNLNRAIYASCLIFAIAQLCGSSGFLAYGQTGGLETAIRRLTPENPEENCTSSSSPMRASPMSSGQYSQQTASSTTSACPKEKNGCTPCETVELACSSESSTGSVLNEAGKCTLTLGNFEIVLLGLMKSIQPQSCHADDNNPQPPSIDLEHVARIAGALCNDGPFTREEFERLFSFNLKRLIFDLLNCQPTLLCELGELGRNEKIECSHDDRIESLAIIYSAIGTLYDEFFHITQSGDLHCKPAACMEQLSAKANLDARREIAALISSLVEGSSEENRNLILDLYCTELWNMGVVVGLEKCICQLGEGFSVSACKGCAKDTLSAPEPSLPDFCKGRPTTAVKEEIREQIVEKYTEEGGDSHSCGSYAADQCLRNLCPRKSPQCLEEKWEQIRKCANEKTGRILYR